MSESFRILELEATCAALRASLEHAREARDNYIKISSMDLARADTAEKEVATLRAQLAVAHETLERIASGWQPADVLRLLASAAIAYAKPAASGEGREK